MTNGNGNLNGPAQYDVYDPLEGMSPEVRTNFLKRIGLSPDVEADRVSARLSSVFMPPGKRVGPAGTPRQQSVLGKPMTLKGLGARTTPGGQTIQQILEGIQSGGGSQWHALQRALFGWSRGDPQTMGADSVAGIPGIPSLEALRAELLSLMEQLYPGGLNAGSLLPPRAPSIPKPAVTFGGIGLS
jgi:hypothetical protein